MSASLLLRSRLDPGFRPGDASRPVLWRRHPGLLGYREAVDEMEAMVEGIHLGQADETVWLVEHPPLYTAGTSARESDLLQPERFPVHSTGRGGEYTYHGPGQRVVYVMLDLKRRRADVRAYVGALEEWIIRTLACFDVKGERREDRVGVWVARPDKPKREGVVAEDKVAAIGVRLRRWVSFHGFAINVAPELSHFSGIVPCGIAGHGVTSLADLGSRATMDELDAALRTTFEDLFGPTF